MKRPLLVTECRVAEWTPVDHARIPAYYEVVMESIQQPVVRVEFLSGKPYEVGTSHQFELSAFDPQP